MPPAACEPGESPEDLAPLRDAFFDALADDFNTAEALAAGVRLDPEANRREGPVGDAQLREMLEVLALDNLLEADEGPPADLIELARAAHRGASGEGLCRGGPAAGRGPRGGLGDPGRPRPAPSSCPWRDHLRPQRGHRGPPRAAAGAADLGRQGGLERGAGHAGLAGRHHRPLRIGRPSGRVRGRRGVPLRERRRAALPPEPFLVALDEVTDPQNLGAVCRTAEVAGATGVILPERRSAEVTPAVCKASAGAVEHLAIAQVRNLADFLATPSRRSAGSTAPTPPPAPRIDPRTTAAGSSWCSARRGKASGRG